MDLTFYFYIVAIALKYEQDSLWAEYPNFATFLDDGGDANERVIEHSDACETTWHIIPSRYHLAKKRRIN
jgi:hypothetical protein